MNTMDTLNPLLNNTELPAFDRIRPEHVGPAVDVLLADAEAALERAVGPDVPADHDTLALLLDVPVERLRRAWAHVNHLQSVADSPALREAHAQALPRIVDFTTRLGADHRLYAKYKAIAASPAAAALSPAQRKALADTLRDFVLGGAELQGAARERHAAIQDRLAALGKTFGDRSLDATDAFQLVVPEARLAGVPADVVAAARGAAEAAGHAGACLLTLQIPCYLPVLQFAQDRALREQLFRAYNTRASDLGPAEFDNTGVMAETAGPAGRRGCAAGPRQLRRAGAGAQDGAHARGGAGLRAPARGTRTPQRRSVNWPRCAISRRPSSASPSCSPGTATSWPKSSSRPVTRSAAKR